MRFDKYNGLTSAAQGEPRLGVAYNFKPTNTVLRVSYARTMETPFNENLVLASYGCNDPVITAFQTLVPGGACVTTTPLSPGHRNEFHAGLQQAFGKYMVIDAEYIWKYTHKAFDFSVLGNTPITYPIEWESSKIPGLRHPCHGSQLSRFFGVRGDVQRGCALLRAADQRHRRRARRRYGVSHRPRRTLQRDHSPAISAGKTGAWIGFNWRYDSGQVAGAMPCAGGTDCANGPGGSNTSPYVVDVSALTPDQQFEAGLYCGSVHATPTTPISPNNLCPASMYGSTLLSAPAPGTSNADHNPPRIASRNLFDAALGDDNIFHGDKRKWSARLEVINLTNTTALYNFLSTFSGTHYVSPRAVTAIGRLPLLAVRTSLSSHAST